MDSVLDLDRMTTEELNKTLREAEAQLEDVLEERRFTLGQTGVHLGAKKVASMRSSWDREEEALRERIAAIKQRLGS